MVNNNFLLLYRVIIIPYGCTYTGSRSISLSVHNNSQLLWICSLVTRKKCWQCTFLETKWSISTFMGNIVYRFQQPAECWGNDMQWQYGKLDVIKSLKVQLLQLFKAINKQGDSGLSPRRLVFVSHVKHYSCYSNNGCYVMLFLCLFHISAV